jgi:hypothetical protein
MTDGLDLTILFGVCRVLFDLDQLTTQNLDHLFGPTDMRKLFRAVSVAELGHRGTKAAVVLTLSGESHDILGDGAPASASRSPARRQVLSSDPAIGDRTLY